MYMHLQIEFKLKFHTRTASAPTKGHRLSNKNSAAIDLGCLPELVCKMLLPKMLNTL